MYGPAAELKPLFIYDETGKKITTSFQPNPAGPKYMRIPTPKKDGKDWISWIREVRIFIAEIASYRKIKSDEKYDYYLTEIGMNIIVPRGKIEELRFRVKLSEATHVAFDRKISSEKIVALDGFPKDVIEEKHIVAGKIKLSIDKTFQFIPVLGPSIPDIVNVQLEPWEFRIGNIRKVNVDFSGGLTSEPEWYFKEDGIKNDLRVALVIQKPKLINDVSCGVEAAWLYDPGFFKKARVGSDNRTILIQYM